MSFTTTLPPLVFDGHQLYVALRTDTPMIRGPIDSAGLHAIANFPGEWTYMAFEDAFKTLTQPSEVATGDSKASELAGNYSRLMKQYDVLLAKINAAQEALK